jgi:hypothetical protein
MYLSRQRVDKGLNETIWWSTYLSCKVDTLFTWNLEPKSLVFFKYFFSNKPNVQSIMVLWVFKKSIFVWMQTCLNSNKECMLTTTKVGFFFFCWFLWLDFSHMLTLDKSHMLTLDKMSELAKRLGCLGQAQWIS